MVDLEEKLWRIQAAVDAVDKVLEERKNIERPHGVVVETLFKAHNTIKKVLDG